MARDQASIPVWYLALSLQGLHLSSLLHGAGGCRLNSLLNAGAPCRATVPRYIASLSVNRLHSLVLDLLCAQVCMQRSLIWLGPDGCLKTGCNNTQFKLQGYPLKKVYLINIRAYKLKLKVCIPTGILFTTAVANAGLPVKQLLTFLLTFRKEQISAFLLKCFTYVYQSFMDYRHLFPLHANWFSLAIYLLF